MKQIMEQRYAKPRQIGRPRIEDHIRRRIKILRREGKSYRQIAHKTGASASTCWRYARDINVAK